MTDRDKTQTLQNPGGTGQRGPANLDDISTQILTDKSNSSVGLLTVLDGAGKGQIRYVYSGTNQLGRSAENRVALDFGDNTISRTQHAVIAYDASKREFTILDGGKPNPVIVNGEQVSGQRRLESGDLIKIGTTTLSFSVL
ncbi:MAG TPA: FHA domain-containing protein [Hyphomicrobiaceae bacterium]|nr:FHA domain-containing protein [Hyphomicrobiaceae bacterium]